MLFSKSLYSRLVNNDVLDNIQLLDNFIKRKDLSFVLKRLNKSIPENKVVHSMRAAYLANKFSHGTDAAIIALCHDYLECGGSLKKLDVSDKIKECIMCLTIEPFFDDYDNPPLMSLIYKIGRLPEEYKNDIIIAKIADRLDNCVMKQNAGELKKKYIDKTISIIQFLWREYTGDKKALKTFIVNSFSIVNKEFDCISSLLN